MELSERAMRSGLVGVMALVVVACGDDEDGTTSAGGSGGGTGATTSTGATSSSSSSSSSAATTSAASTTSSAGGGGGSGGSGPIADICAEQHLSTVDGVDVIVSDVSFDALPYVHLPESELVEDMPAVTADFMALRANGSFVDRNGIEYAANLVDPEPEMSAH